MQAYHILPLCAAFVYTLGALCLKRATNDGVGPWRTTFFSNLVLMVATLPYWFFGDPLEDWTLLWMPLVFGVAFFVGQLLTCLGIHKGEVSLLTPLMGTKTIFVAFVVSLGLSEALTFSVWLAAFLSAGAVLLMGLGSVSSRRRVMPTIYLGLGASFSFALADVAMQAFGPHLGFPKMVASGFVVVMLLSLLLLPLFKAPVNQISGKAWSWVLVGAALMAVQATGMAYVLSAYGKATVVNVVYSSRGIFSVALVWFVGHWFSNEERQQGGSVMARRLTGSLMLVVAILLAMG